MDRALCIYTPDLQNDVSTKKVFTFKIHFKKQMLFFCLLILLSRQFLKKSTIYTYMARFFDNYTEKKQEVKYSKY